MYKDPESAFAAFNTQRKATIGLQDILNHSIVTNSGYQREDVKSYLLREKVFASEISEMDYMQFKKFFFPKLMLIEARAEDALLRQDELALASFNQIQNKQGALNFDSARQVSVNSLTKVKQLQEARLKKDQETYVRERLVKLTNFLRERFQKTWVSVRKAFLDLDINKDGVISSEDIMRFFGDAGNNSFDYFDLVKILEDLDSKHKGTLNYNDFCRWMGGAIHKSEGFYFRHDSVKNPPFEANLTKMESCEQALRKTQKKQLTSEMMQQLAKKIEFQWKTLKTAFKALNLGKSGKIQRWELKYWCDHWGFSYELGQFDEIFVILDIDQDGEISY